MRLHLRKVTAAVGLMLVVGTASSEAAVEPVSPAQITGEETIFRAVFFGEGRLAQRIHGSTWETPESRAASDQLIESIRATSPEYLSSFAATMTSGDRPQISKALADGDRRLEAAADSLGKASGTSRIASAIVISGYGTLFGTGVLWAPPVDSAGQLSTELLSDQIAGELGS
jgi:hypothetical protein